MNLNANQLKVLAYVKGYLHKELPSHRQMARDLGMSNNTVSSRLNSLERWELIRTEATDRWHNRHARVKRLVYWRDPPAGPDLSAAARPDLSMAARARVLAEGTRR